MKISLAFLAVLMTLVCQAQTTPEDMIKKFFTDYKTDTDKAIDDIYGTNPWTKALTEGINNVKREIKTYTEDYMGKYYGYELLTKQISTENFVLYTYFVRYGRQPMKFVFEFYRPNDKWMLFSFNMDASIDDDVEQAAKYYLSQPKE